MSEDTGDSIDELSNLAVQWSKLKKKPDPVYAKDMLQWIEEGNFDIIKDELRAFLTEMIGDKLPIPVESGTRERKSLLQPTKPMRLLYNDEYYTINITKSTTLFQAKKLLADLIFVPAEEQSWRYTKEIKDDDLVYEHWEKKKFVQIDVHKLEHLLRIKPRDQRPVVLSIYYDTTVSDLMKMVDLNVSSDIPRHKIGFSVTKSSKKLNLQALTDLMRNGRQPALI